MIRYKLLKAEMTGDVFPQQVETLPFTTKDLKESVRKRYGSMSAAVIDETLRIIAQQLGEGKTVSLEEFGSFSIRLGLDKKGIKDFEDVRTQDIRIKGIRFKAAKELRRQLSDQEIHLQKGDKQRRTITTGERWILLYDYIMKQYNEYATPFSEIVISVSTYRNLTGCTDYTARKELALFCEEGKLRMINAGKIKLYVLTA